MEPISKYMDVMETSGGQTSRPGFLEMERSRMSVLSKGLLPTT